MRVLIADGDDVFLEIAQDYLSNCGHEVNIARNGLEAVASLRRGLPDVVVLERELLWGGSDGVRSLMRQIPRWSETPLILTSSDGIPEESDSATGPPVVARLQKPYRLKDLLVHLQACSLNATPSPVVSCCSRRNAMTVNTKLSENRRGIATEFQRRSARNARFEALDKSDLTELSAAAINNMTCDELVRMIRVAGLPDQLCPNMNKRLPFYDHTALTRLAHLAQHCCRNHGQRSLEKDAE